MVYPLVSNGRKHYDGRGRFRSRIPRPEFKRPRDYLDSGDFTGWLIIYDRPKLFPDWKGHGFYLAASRPSLWCAVGFDWGKRSRSENRLSPAPRVSFEGRCKADGAIPGLLKDSGMRAVGNGTLAEVDAAGVACSRASRCWLSAWVCSSVGQVVLLPRASPHVFESSFQAVTGVIFMDKPLWLRASEKLAGKPSRKHRLNLHPPCRFTTSH